jgi:hypothetical protein
LEGGETIGAARYPWLMCFKTSHMLALVAFCLTVSCASRFSIPNAAMSGAPGPIQLAFERDHKVLDAPGFCSSSEDMGGVTSIAIERTSCYGFCSMYTLTIHSDGTVDYRGEANVEHAGLRKGKLGQDQFRYLALLASEIGYFDLSDNYSCMVTDNPTVFTRVEQNGRTKIIRHYAPSYAGPARLRAFEEAVDSAYGWIEWQH